MKIPRWLIPSILLIVMIDQWVSATGEADPYQITNLFGYVLPHSFSLTSAARGIAIMLAITYGIDTIQSFLDSKLGWMRRIGHILIGCVSLMLLIETTVITPYIITSMGKTEMATTLRTIQIFGFSAGEQIYFLWALMVAIMPPLGVVIAALASISAPIEEPKTIVRKPMSKPQPIQATIVPNDGASAPETIQVPLSPRAPQIPNAVRARFRANQVKAK